MKYLIQKNLINQGDLHQIVSALKKHNMEYELIEIIPFTDQIIAEPPLVGKSYFPYGSTSLTNISYRENFLGLHFDLETFNYEAALANRDDMLNDNVMTLTNAITFLNEEIANGNANTDWFVRPSEDLKQFSGIVVTAREAHDWFFDMMSCATSGSYKLEPSTKVVVSEPKKIYSEIRFFIVDGEIVEGSLYRLHGDLHRKRIPDSEISFYNNFVKDKWIPDDCCVMDLAETPYGFKVIEFNCINSSGFYDCNIDNIFSALKAYHY